MCIESKKERNYKMFKTILKVIYFALAFFLSIITYMVSYQGNIYDVLFERANGYIEKGDYDQLSRMFGGIFNSDERIDGSLDEYHNDKVRIQLYEGTTEASYTYYVKDKDSKGKEIDVQKTYHAYDKAYYLYLFDVKFDTANVSGEDNKLTNKTSISFFNEEGQEYKYLLTSSSTINADNFRQMPRDKYESVLNGNRDLNSFAKSWGFYSVIIDETLIEAVEAKLNPESPIVAFNINDNEGKKLYSSNVAFDFSFEATAESSFYSDTQILYDAYDKLMPLYDKHKNGEISKDEYKKAYDEFNKTIEPFDTKLKEGGFPSYLQSFTQKELVPGWVTWKTMGEVLLLVLAIFVVYLLLFKFRQVSASFSRLWGKITGKKPEPKAKGPRPSYTKGNTPEMRVKPEAMRKHEDDNEVVDAEVVTTEVEANAVEATEVVDADVEAKEVEANALEATEVAEDNTATDAIDPKEDK